MSFDIEEIPLVEDARLGRRAGSDASIADAYPDFPSEAGGVLDRIPIDVALRLGHSIERLAFPNAAQLAALTMPTVGAAAGPSYTYYSNCGGYDYNGTCSEACFGFAPDHMDPFFCATCAEQSADPVNNPAYNWHFVGMRGQIRYIDREPDVCNGKDAWKWTITGACGNCATSSVFRCHDGYKKLPDRSYWEPTICQGLVSCDNRLTPCP
jgi:hypothetical protein